MGFRVSLRSERCKTIPTQWAATYNDSGNLEKVLISDQLKSLQEKDLRPEVINAITGCPSWTDHRCDECNNQSEALVFFDYSAIAVCGNCLAKASASLVQLKVGERE